MGVNLFQTKTVISPVAKRNTPSREITAHFSLHFATPTLIPARTGNIFLGRKNYLSRLAANATLHYH